MGYILYIAIQSCAYAYEISISIYTKNSFKVQYRLLSSLHSMNTNYVRQSGTVHQMSYLLLYSENNVVHNRFIKCILQTYLCCAMLLEMFTA